MNGKVYLVGAGPGDPELITMRGYYLLTLADTLLYDNLASPVLVDRARTGAEKIYVGKKRSHHTFTVEEIVALMVEHARQGRTVVRLKGGDPFIFGRGGEEVEGLAAAGVPYEVVPGITTPLGIAAYTGVPLTHREHTSAVTFVTGHDPDAIDWPRVGAAGTLVLFMALHTLRDIANRLIAAGRPPETPAMVVRWATRPDQKTLVGTLGDIADRVEQQHLLPPATVMIGEVVRLHHRFDWFGRRPLFGTSIIVTRAREQSLDLWLALSELGANVVGLPVIELAPLDDYTRLDDCLGRLSTYDWLIFTSTNAVDYFMSRLDASGRDNRAIAGQVCAIGSATARRLREYRLRADLVPDQATSEGVAAAFASQDLAGKRVLIPRAAAAREVIPEALQAMGAQVDIADAYRNVIPAGAEQKIREYLAGGHRADWITFTSSSTVRNWLVLAGRESLDGVRIASIGPATSDVIRSHGLPVHAEAEPHTVHGLVNAILNAS